MMMNGALISACIDTLHSHLWHCIPIIIMTYFPVSIGKAYIHTFDPYFGALYSYFMTHFPVSIGCLEMDSFNLH